MSVTLQECNDYVDGTVCKRMRPQAVRGQEDAPPALQAPSADPRAEMLQHFEEECELLSHAEAGAACIRT